VLRPRRQLRPASLSSRIRASNAGTPDPRNTGLRLRGLALRSCRARPGYGPAIEAWEQRPRVGSRRRRWCRVVAIRGGGGGGRPRCAPGAGSGRCSPCKHSSAVIPAVGVEVAAPERPGRARRSAAGSSSAPFAAPRAGMPHAEDASGDRGDALGRGACAGPGSEEGGPACRSRPCRAAPPAAVAGRTWESNHITDRGASAQPAEELAQLRAAQRLVAVRVEAQRDLGRMSRESSGARRPLLAGAGRPRTFFDQLLVARAELGQARCDRRRPRRRARRRRGRAAMAALCRARS
jgi:hypothetical protein